MKDTKIFDHHHLAHAFQTHYLVNTSPDDRAETGAHLRFSVRQRALTATGADDVALSATAVESSALAALRAKVAAGAAGAPILRDSVFVGPVDERVCVDRARFGD